MLLAGAFGVGFLLQKKGPKACAFLTYFGIMSFVLMLFGSYVVKYGKTMRDQYDDLCIDRRDTMEELHAQATKYISKTMCSEECPCWSGYMIKETEKELSINQDENYANFFMRMVDMKKTEKLWDVLPEETVNKFGRTKEDTAITILGGDTLTPIIWQDYRYDLAGNKIAYHSFLECFEEKLMPSAYLIRDPKADTIESVRQEQASLDEFFKRNGLFTFMAQLEQDYECAGLCEPNLFYIQRRMDEGPPTTDCMSAPYLLWNTNDGKGGVRGMPLCNLAMAVGVINFLTFLFAGLPLYMWPK